MERIITAAALTMVITLAQAMPPYHPSGPNLTYGAVSNRQTIMSNITNPAAGAAALQQNGNQYRFGILSSIGAGVEFGKIDGLYEKIDAQANTFSKGVSIDKTNFAGSITTQVNAVNNVLNDVGSPDGTGLQPFACIVWKQSQQRDSRHEPRSKHNLSALWKSGTDTREGLRDDA